jgi:hypothetical protein
MPTPIKAIRYAKLEAKEIKILLVELPEYLEMMDETEPQADYMRHHPALAKVIQKW